MNKKLVFSLLLVGMLAILVTSCGGPDKKLNGVWVGEMDYGVDVQYTFNNGNFECLIDDVPYVKGSYTTKDGVLTWVMKEVHGGAINYLYDYQILQSKWFSLNDFVNAARNALSGIGASEREISEFLNDFTNPTPDNYTVNGNTLVTTSTPSGTTIIFTKQ